MSVQTPLGSAYIERLREYRDLSIVRSRHSDDRTHIGSFSIGKVYALWTMEMGGRASLTDSGIWWGGKRLVSRTTTLHLRHGEIANGGNVELTLFRMDLDQEEPMVEVFKTMELPDRPLMGALSTRRDRDQYRAYGLSTFTESDEKGELLFNEMQRGASGCFSPSDHFGGGSAT